ncbi:hypothetical protein ACFLTZ_01100 [Chloroflexota bacterium]
MTLTVLGGLWAIIQPFFMMVVFGSAGGRIDRREIHFRERTSQFPESTRERNVAKDTPIFNVTMPLMLEKIYKLYNLEPIVIVNCSRQSHYTPFRKLSSC